mmetsp:Transcript_10246/g.16778  ORF Transcript_10246/g.16778 Transcript_10246/m.16778 type:complete len:161 (-) Transcript_10246:507-989(-)
MKKQASCQQLCTPTDAVALAYPRERRNASACTSPACSHNQRPSVFLTRPFKRDKRASVRVSKSQTWYVARDLAVFFGGGQYRSSLRKLHTFIHSFIHLLVDPFICGFIHSFMDASYARELFHELKALLVLCKQHCTPPVLTLSFISSFILSCILSFVLSF